MKLKSKGASVRVEFAVLYATFSMEGYIKEFDGETLTVEGVPPFGFLPATLDLSAFRLSTFDGDFREDESEMFLTLMITRPASEKPYDVYRFHVVAEWRQEGAKSPRIN